MEQERSLESLAATLEVLTAAAGALEQAVSRLEVQHSAMSGQVQRIVATVDAPLAQDRIADLERRLQEAMGQIAEMKAQSAAPVATGRKTLAAPAIALLAKQGISNLDSLEAGSLDAAMSSLSIEQRIAVKSQLLRAGLLG
jgi:predicted  nucleic acid-binding Zn-ribbon protein